MSDLVLQGGSSGGSGGGSDWLQLALQLAAVADAPEPAVRDGRRLTHVQLMTARPGQPMTRLYGRMRVGGHIIWRGALREHVSESGGDDGDKGGGRPTPRRRHYRYTLHLAIGLCEGPVSHIGRIWADGHLLDGGTLALQLHKGEADAEPDPLIEAAMGAGNTPAFRGLAYVTLRDFDVSRFGNRVPQLAFEVFRPIEEAAAPVRGVCLLPGANEFAYHPQPHVRLLGLGRARSENLNADAARADWEISLDQLQDAHPECRRVALVVAWFGNDLRAGQCRLLPKVDNKDKQTLPSRWQVAGVDRAAAERVSLVDGAPAFGGTPSDASVTAAIRDLHRRGFEVMFYPFIIMDIAAGNRLTDPYAGGRGQPVYPWRGRITCTPAPGRPDSPDGRRAVRRQIARFVNGRRLGDPFCLRGMMLHYAKLCAEAGGVEAFLLGSELRGLSRLYDEQGRYPFAEHLAAMAAAVRPMLPDSKISYAADWSEYGAQVTHDSDVGFPLDRFWADNECDFVGIDNYLPLADWRDGPAHLDAGKADAVTDIGYLKSNVRGGEYFDWYYGSEADRQAQTRRPITDGQGEPWLYRAKDIQGWWQNEHRPRRGGVRQAATGWVPAGKPVRFTELGCPAVDKGANQPNVFPDTRSSEGAIPHFSTGTRDDHMQAAYLTAMSGFYDEPANNPRSPVYDGPMLDTGHIYIWAWDARPFPYFPYRTDIWRDGPNWQTGHWLNGRHASAPLGPLLGALAGPAELRLHGLQGAVDGFAVRGISSPAAEMRPLLQAFGIDARADGAVLLLQGRGSRPVRDIAPEAVIRRSGTEGGAVRRQAAEAELPRRFDLHYLDADNDYGPTHVSARHDGGDAPVQRLDLPAALGTVQAAQLAARLLHAARHERARLQLALPPDHLDLEAGDLIRFDGALWRITELTHDHALEVTAVRHQRGLYGAFRVPPPLAALPQSVGRIALPHVLVADLPAAARPDLPPGVPAAAGFAAPWPGAVSLIPSKGDARDLPLPGRLGRTLSPLPRGPVGRWDRGTALDVELFGGGFESLPQPDVLNGANRLALQTPQGWEVVQFARAELIGERRYRLRHMLRGQYGSDAAMAALLPAGADCLAVDAALQPLADAAADLPPEMQLAFGPAALPRDSYAWQSLRVMPRRAGLACLSPVHLKVMPPRRPQDALTVGWVRRSRLGGDDFEAADIPLGETEEAYAVRLLADGQTVETHRVTAPHFAVTATGRAALRAARPQAAWQIEVAQINSSGSAGAAARAALPAL